MKKTTPILAALALLLGGIEQATAGTIAVVSTGLDGSNKRIVSGGVTDAHWTSTVDATYSPSGLTQTVFPNNADWYGGWLGNGPNSDWIARNASVTNNGPAPYTFYRTFDLTGYDLSTVSLSGLWTIDDQGTLDLNGNQLSSLGNGNWGGFTTFSAATADFNQGLNTLSITITSDDQFLEAVRLEGTVTGDLSAAPEPATLTMLGMGVASLFGYGWRRRTLATA